MIDIYGIKTSRVSFDQKTIIIYALFILAMSCSFFVIWYLKNKDKNKYSEPQVVQKQENYFLYLDELSKICESMKKEEFLNKLNKIIKSYMIKKWLSGIDTMTLTEIKKILSTKSGLPEARIGFFFNRIVSSQKQALQPDNWESSEFLVLFKKIYLGEFDGQKELWLGQKLKLINDIKNIIVKKEEVS